MSFFKKVHKILSYAISQPAVLGMIIMRRFLFLLPDKLYLKLYFRLEMGYSLNLDNPQTFSEKLQWLKLYDRNPLHTGMADKYEVKKYIEKRIGNKYNIPLLGVWSNVDEIDFDQLPDKFVLKTTHDSGGVRICYDKQSFMNSDYKQFFKAHLSHNYYRDKREWPYKNITPRIIAEPLIESESGDLKDYKFFCFNGEPKYCLVISERSVGYKISFYDLNWNRINLTEVGYQESKNEFDRPINYDKMLELASALSFGEKFLRVDMYNEKGRIYCGELTFFPCSGFVEFQPSYYNDLLGGWIDINND
ncbi:MAG: glycosyl transferase [Paludibacteraceae bacterium]|nr:glycosyl transferase [Paludibacteraceae bacterium]